MYFSGDVRVCLAGLTPCWVERTHAGQRNRNDLTFLVGKPLDLQAEGRVHRIFQTACAVHRQRSGVYGAQRVCHLRDPEGDDVHGPAASGGNPRERPQEAEPGVAEEPAEPGVLQLYRILPLLLRL